ncbi:hypothetical protein BGZ81_008366 [Podila clonocystis]|nr:hypothetical protein BGZ81_008366 [Podila clonocystis]
MRVTTALISAFVLAASAMAQHSCTRPNWGPGICIRTSDCTRSGGSYVSGACPNDPADVKCCTYGTCQVPDNGWGICIPSGKCTSTRVPGYCKGGADIQCCLE